MSQVRVDLADPTPPYEQLRRGILGQVREGALAPGDRLPTIRALARDLGLAPGTVARAYKQLEEDGLLLTARGAGTRVAPEAVAAARAAAPEEPRTAPLAATGGVVVPPTLRGLMEDAVEAARSDGHDDPSILAAVQLVLRGPRTERS